VAPATLVSTKGEAHQAAKAVEQAKEKKTFAAEAFTATAAPAHTTLAPAVKVPSQQQPSVEHPLQKQQQPQQHQHAGLVSLDAALTSRNEGLEDSSPSEAPRSAAQEPTTLAPRVLQPPAYQQPAPPQHSWLTHLWSWITGSKTSEPAAKPAAPVGAAFLATEAHEHAPRLEVREALRQRTAREAVEEMSHPVLIGDAFSALEAEDANAEDSLRSWDHGLKVMTENRPEPAKPSPGMGIDPVTNGASDASSFWNTMANEDEELESSLNENSKDLSKYEKITHLQDVQMAGVTARSAADPKADGATVRMQRLLHRKPDPAIQAGLHDVFSEMEKTDGQEVDRIKKSPYLRMMQLSEKHRTA